MPVMTLTIHYKGYIFTLSVKKDKNRHSDK